MIRTTTALVFAFVCVTSTHAQLRVVSYNIAKCIGDYEALHTIIDATSLDDSQSTLYQFQSFCFKKSQMTIKQ